MAASEKLLVVVRKALAREKGVAEIKMFGGVCFMLRGHMLCGVESARFMVRVGPESDAKALALPGTSPMDFTGRPLKGYVYVKGEGALKPVLTLARAFNATLPPKTKKAQR